MSSGGGRLALGTSAGLAALAAAALLTGRGATDNMREPGLVQLPVSSSLITQAPATIAATPAAMPSPPAAAAPWDPGIWSTPAQFAPPE